MSRSEHFLFRARPSPWPKTVVCLHVEVKWTNDATNAMREQCILSTWHVTVVTAGKCGYAISRSACGATTESFWNGMKECLSYSKGVHMICSCTRVAAAALYLWEGLENGTIKVSGTDHRSAAIQGGQVSDLSGGGEGHGRRPPVTLDASSLPKLRGPVGKETGNRRGNRRRGRNNSAGIMILEDPPLVMELQLHDCSGKITWVDAANYGIDAAATFGDDEHSAGKIAAWFIDAAATIKACGDAGWQNTAGSQAMHLFRSSYLETQILSHVHPIATSLEAEALFGGRCECFRIGKIAGPCHLLDIRSMYPYLCANMDVPIRLCRVVERPTVFALRDATASSFCIASVDIETDSPDYPYRGKSSVFYPTGRFATCLCGSELCHALSVGAVRRVRHAACYESERALGRYATELYAKRQEYDRTGQGDRSAYAKRLMVSLVGKFAQRERSWAEVPGAESAFEWGEWYTRSASGESERWRSIGGFVQREQLGGFSHGAIPSITASITAGGRTRLGACISAAGRDNVVYCDTDAVIVNDYGLEGLTMAGWVQPGSWGFLQHVESADGATIIGDKAYQIGGRCRAAGTNRNTARTGDIQDASYTQPWIGASMRHQERPADWREAHSYHRGEGRYDRLRNPGGGVKPIELWGW